MKKILLLILLFHSIWVSANNVLVHIHNETSTALILIRGDLKYGTWTQFQPPNTINAKSNAQFGATTATRVVGVPLTGVEGSVRYKIGNGEFYIYFNNPLVAGSKGNSFNIQLYSDFEYRVTGGTGGDAVVHVYIRKSTPHYVGNFRPSTHGFPYENNWKGYGNYTVANTPFGRIPGGADNGLCGGMSYAVRDYYEAGLPIPTTKPPTVDDPFFTYLKDRLLQSLNPIDVSLFLKYSDPTYPDTDENLLNWVPVLGYQGRAFTVIAKEWPIIQADILAGKLACLGLVYTKELNLGVNHQVVCYGYHQQGNIIELKIYDPNQPNKDNIYIRFNNTNLASQLQLENNLTSKRVLNCLFRTNYENRRPPSLEALIADTPLGGTLNIPAGNYVMRKPAKITKKITLKATGGKVTIK